MEGQAGPEIENLLNVSISSCNCMSDSRRTAEFVLCLLPRTIPYTMRQMIAASGMPLKRTRVIMIIGTSFALPGVDKGDVVVFGWLVSEEDICSASEEVSWAPGTVFDSYCNVVEE